MYSSHSSGFITSVHAAAYGYFFRVHHQGPIRTRPYFALFRELADGEIRELREHSPQFPPVIVCRALGHILLCFMSELADQFMKQKQNMA